MPRLAALARLYQPRNPQFWLLLILNALSSVIAYLLQRYEFTSGVTLLLAAFAIGNAVLGLRLAWQLTRTPDAGR